MLYGFGGSGSYTFKVIECSRGGSVPLVYAFFTTCFLSFFSSFDYSIRT